jgi:hypothetical protein
MAGHIFYSFLVPVDGYIAAALPGPEEALHRHFNAVQERMQARLLPKASWTQTKPSPT